MHATPRTALAFNAVIYLNFDFRRMSIEILAIVRDPKTGFLRFDVQRMRQAEIAKLEMMTIRLAISRDMHEISAPRSLDELLHQPPARRERSLKRYGLCQWSIVEEDSE